ncbi:MAG: family 16 glycosylhydrolase [Chitinophagales bacterium]|nr:family 16 glycosylhydrolase [Chitinophagales bacterium]
MSKNLITDTTNILTLKSGATVSSVSSSSFVSGPINKIGNSAFTFPIGKGSAYKPVAITAPSSSTDAFTAEYFGSQQSHGSNKDSITYLSACEYWNVKRTAGSSNIKITLYWDNSTCAIYTLQTLKIGRWDGSKWNNTGMCTTTGNTASGSIQTNNNLSAFGDFMIAKRSPAVFAHAGNDISICSGVSHAVGASPSATSGLTPYTYAWSPSTALSSSSVANPTSTATSTTHYILTVTDLDHTVAVDTIIVTVHPNPIADAGDDTTMCKDFEFHIGGNPTASYGTLPYNYLWKNVSGDTLFQVTNPFVESDTSFISFLTVTDSFGCKGRDSIEVSVPTPIEIDFDFDTTLYLNQSVQLNPQVSGGVGSLNYSWSPSLWLNDSTIVNPVCVPRSSIRYTLVVGDSLNCIREAFTRIRFSPIDLQALNQYAIFSPDSIFVGDSSIAIGGVGSRQVDTSYLHIPFGFLETDSFVLASLTDQLSEIMDGIDGLAADTIDGDLSGDTLYSGTYRIAGSAQLNGTLTLAGNDSSYIILDIDSDWNVSDFSKIVHSGIVDDKVFFSVNGKIVMGDSLELNCFFLSEKSISIGSFVGSAVFLVKESTTISSSAFKLECTNDDPDCWTQLDFLTIQIELPDKLPRTRKGLVWNSEHTLVFDDEFATDLNILSWTIDEWWDERTNYQWYEYGGWGDEERKTFYDPEVTGAFSGITTYATIDGNLILRATNLETEVGQSYPAKDADGNDYNYKYSAGSIESNARFYHGYFEIKAKMPYGQGMWPSFWMIDGTCPGGQWWVPDHDDKREIDFFDASLPKTVFPVVEFYDHCQDGWLEYFACPKDQEGNSVNLSDNWHIYAADWDNDIITYYVDGVPMLSYTSESTMPNIMGVRDQAMRLELGTGVTSENAPNFASNATTGTAPGGENSERDFQIEYIKIWQKKNHVSDCYFVNDFNGERIDPIFCLSNTFHVATTYIQDATYSWTLPANWTATDFLLYQTASSEKLITPSSTAAGSYTIHLKITLPQIGNQKAGIVDEQDINVWIGEPDAPTFDYAPTPFYLYANNHCTIFPVDNADSYEWDFTLGNGDPSDGLILSPSGTYCGIETLEPGSYKIKARAHNVCGYSEWSQLTLYVNDEPCSGNGCKVLDSTSLNSLIQIYPSPSDGHLSIKNNSNEKVFITLKMINGIAVTNFYLQPDESTKINNLPQGLLLAESWIESNHTLLLRQLIPIVNP